MKRKALAILLAFSLFNAGTWNVQAAAHKVGCGATGTYNTCREHCTTVERGHRLYVTENGTEVTCNIRETVRLHNQQCQGCDVVLATGIVLSCLREHQYCPNETGLCQK